MQYYDITLRKIDTGDIVSYINANSLVIGVVISSKKAHELTIAPIKYRCTENYIKNILIRNNVNDSSLFSHHNNPLYIKDTVFILRKMNIN